MNENLKCEFCGCELTEESAVRFDGVVMCERCYEQETVPCADCGTVIWIENAQGDDDTHLCDSCYEHYTHCEECGRLIHNSDAYYPDDDDYSYCYECYQKFEERPIRSYSYKPEPIFYGSGNLYYGIELEIDKGGEFDENAERLLDIANSLDERLYCKHDGSINEGFEIVSHPMSLDYHIHDMNWPDILDKAVNMNYRSHNTSTCGLHIHVNRSAFGKDTETQEEAIGRVVYFVEHHWNELVKFSRRTPENLNHWAARFATISNTTQETYKKAKDKQREKEL